MKQASNTLLLANRYGKTRSVVFNPLHACLLILAGIIVIGGSIHFSGFRSGVNVEARHQLSDVDELRTVLQQQQTEIVQTRKSAQDNLDVLTMRLGRLQAQVLRLDIVGERLVRHMTTQEKGKTLNLYWASNCKNCAIRAQCTSGVRRKMSRWEHEALLEQVEARLDRNPHLMRVRRSTVEHPFGTLKAWMGSTHFLTKTLSRVNTEMSLHVLAYNLRRMLNLVGTKPLIEAIQG